MEKCRNMRLHNRRCNTKYKAITKVTEWLYRRIKTKRKKRRKNSFPKKGRRWLCINALSKNNAIQSAQNLMMVNQHRFESKFNGRKLFCINGIYVSVYASTFKAHVSDLQQFAQIVLINNKLFGCSDRTQTHLLVYCIVNSYRFILSAT